MIMIADNPPGFAPVRDLPDFTNPPIVEVVQSIQFASLSSFRSAHVGLLWERFRSRYPNVTEQPPLGAMFETFGTPMRAAPPIEVQTFLTAPMPRYMFEATEGDHLIQFQQDRVIHNWRKQAEDDRPYPRYEAVKAAFVNDVETFSEWLRSENLGEIRVNQCELIYTNIIEIGEDEAFTDALARVTPTWVSKAAPDLPSLIEDVNLQFRYIFARDQKPVGRLFIQFMPALRAGTWQRVLRMDITARGRPKTETIQDAFELLDEERNQIVRSFAAVTSKQMHQAWGRTDG